MINPIKKNCPVCGNAESSFLSRNYDDRYGYRGLFDYLRCSACRHIFINSFFATDEITDLYSNYYPRKNFDLGKYKTRNEIKGFRSWLRGERRYAYTYVPRNVRVLDIGCGLAETLGYHRSRGCDVYGVEADENVRSIAEKFNFKIHIGLFNPSVYPENFFDFITMDQVVEHMLDPVEELKGIASALKKGGKVILSTPNANGWGRRWFKDKWLHWHSPYHVGFFSARSMRMAAEKSGLSLLKTIHVTYSEWLYWQWVHLLFYPEPGQPSLFWKYMSRKYYSETQKKNLDRIEKRRKYRINDIITRIFDLLTMGDNYIFILTKP